MLRLARGDLVEEGPETLRRVVEGRRWTPDPTGRDGHKLGPADLAVEFGHGAEGRPAVANLMELSRRLPAHLMACLIARAPARGTQWGVLLREHRNPARCEAVEAGGYLRHVLRGLFILRSILQLLALEAKRGGEGHAAEVGLRGGPVVEDGGEASAARSRAIFDLSVLGVLHGLEGMRRCQVVAGGSGVGGVEGGGGGGGMSTAEVERACFLELAQESFLVLQDVYGPFAGYDCGSRLWADMFQSLQAPQALAAAVQGTYWAGTRDAFRTVTGAFRHAPGATSSRPDLEASRGLRKAANMMKLLATVLASPVAYLGLLEYEYHAQHSQRPEGRAAGAMGGARNLTHTLLCAIKDALELRCRTVMPSADAPASPKGWNMSQARAESAASASSRSLEALAGRPGFEGLLGGAFPTAASPQLRELLTSLANEAVLLLLCLTDSDKREYCGEQAEFLDQVQLGEASKADMATIAKLACHLFEQYMTHLGMRYRPNDLAGKDGGASFTAETLLGYNLLRLMEILVADSNYDYCSRYIARCVAVHLIQPPESFQWMWLFEATQRGDAYKKFLGFDLMRAAKIEGADRSICMPQTEGWEILQAYLCALKFHHMQLNTCSGALERMILFFKLIGILHEVKFPAGSEHEGKPVLVGAVQQVLEQVLRAWGQAGVGAQAPNRAELLGRAERNAHTLRAYVGEEAPMALYSLQEYELLTSFHGELEGLKAIWNPQRKRMRLLPGSAKSGVVPGIPGGEGEGGPPPQIKPPGQQQRPMPQDLGNGGANGAAGALAGHQPPPPAEYEGGSRMRAYAT